MYFNISDYWKFLMPSWLNESTKIKSMKINQRLNLLHMHHCFAQVRYSLLFFKTMNKPVKPS